jgi:Uncharacterised nucleotidyltransferase
VDGQEAVSGLIDRLIAAGRDDAWLRAQRLLPLVAERRFRRSLPVSAQQRREARAVAADQAVAEHLLAEIRAAVDGPVLVVKGPESAACHPRPGLRPFADVDVLVSDADAAAVSLERNGFTWQAEGPPSEDHHHLPPFTLTPLLMPVEVHARPAWVAWCAPPPWTELLADAEPSRTGIAGLQRPSDAHHAVLVAVHAWRTRPYGRLLDLIDVWLLAQSAGVDRAAAVAERWDVGRLWRTTWAAAEALVGGTGRAPVGVHLLARHLLGHGEPPLQQRARYAGGLLLTAPHRALPDLARRAPAALSGGSASAPAR